LKQEKEEEQMLLNPHPTNKNRTVCLLYSMEHATEIFKKPKKQSKIPIISKEMEWPQKWIK